MANRRVTPTSEGETTQPPVLRPARQPRIPHAASVEDRKVGNSIGVGELQRDHGTDLYSPPNGARQWPTRVGANFAQAKFVTTKEVHCTRGLGGGTRKACGGS